MRNVARTWAFETGILLNEQLSPQLPYNDYYEYFSPDYELDVRPSNMDNANTKEYLDKIRSQVIENLKRTAFAPSVQMTDVPRDPLVPGMDDEADAEMDDLDEDENKDVRHTKRRFDQYIEKTGELSDSEDEAELASHGIRRQPGAVKRRNQANYRDMDNEETVPLSSIATPREASLAPGQGEATAVAAGAVAEKTNGDTSTAEREKSPSAAAAQTTDEAAEDGKEVATGSAATPAREEPQTTEDVEMEDVGEAPRAGESEQPASTEPTIQENTPPASPPREETAESKASGKRSTSPMDEAPQPEASATEPIIKTEDASQAATAEETKDAKPAEGDVKAEEKETTEDKPAENGN